MIVKHVYNTQDGILNIPKEVLPENGIPFSHHFQSNHGDNLIELAGKICYDSCQNPKSRDSKSYHEHINEVGHWSTHSHLNFTLELPIQPDDLNEYLSCFVNKPGYWVRVIYDSVYNPSLRITGNLRAIREWFTFNTEIAQKSPSEFDCIGYCLQSWARLITPEAIKGCKGSKTMYKHAGSLVIPQDVNEIWVSYYIGGISRSNSHELVRHSYNCAVSQRSSRYCDESQSDWAWHPLILKYRKEINNIITPPGPLDGHFDTGYTLSSCEEGSRQYYNTLVKFLENKLISEGIDKNIARKQGRGAARGILGNALSTELIFSASLAQWQRIILMRSRDEADAEIRLMTNEIFKDLKEKWPNFFYNFTSRPAKDGIGLHVEKI